jgi:hypothetical protein
VIDITPTVPAVATGVVKGLMGVVELTATLVALVKVDAPAVAVTAKE